MLSKKVQDKLNAQVQEEFYSSYLYLAMAVYCESINLPGFGKWFRVQAQEEWGHGMRILDYLGDRGGAIELQGLQKPPLSFGTPVAVFEAALAHEKHITSAINEIYAAAVKDNDYGTQIMLQWFVNEQIEEEKTVTDIIALLKMAGEHIGVLDQRLGKRGE